MKKLVLLGSTGSIGTQTLDIVRNYKDELSCIAVAAMKSVDRIEEQVREFKPELVCMMDENAAKELKTAHSSLCTLGMKSQISSWN